jgi:vacuolar-type H+-ATPase subunit E/Vma4
MRTATSDLGRDPPDAAVVAELERVELAARERRLIAQAEADRILAEADRTAAEIESGVGARIDAALAEKRRDLLERATTEAAAIDAAVASDDDREGRVARSPAFDDAVESLVAAVLGETRR